MTPGGRLISLFPAFYFLIIVITLGWSFQIHAWWAPPIILLEMYFLPLILFRIHNLFLPLREGTWDLAEKRYNVWWASYMFQYPFIALPWIESLLHFFPGLFSLWLRAWGSKIGRGVTWTPRVEILDRAMVEIGDNVVLGHLTTMSSHVISNSSANNKPRLMIKKIRIGERALIGADSQLGPGATVEPRVTLKPKTRLYWKGTWS